MFQQNRDKALPFNVVKTSSFGDPNQNDNQIEPELHEIKNGMNKGRNFEESTKCPNSNKEKRNLEIKGCLIYFVF